MAKKELKLHAVVAPTPTVIVSAYDENGKADACTLAFYMVSSHVPPCVTIAINATARRKTLKDILAENAFVLGFPSADQAKEADYIGVESGYNTDKLKNIGFTVSEARTVHAPVINELLLSLECEVVRTMTVGSHTQITGEVKNILADESILDGKGKILLEKLQPLIYDEEGLIYRRVGEKTADAFKTGAGIIKQLEKQSAGNAGEEAKDDSGQLRRIRYYEELLRDAEQMLRAEELPFGAWETLESRIRELNDYYGSDAWKQDLADDEAGLLPQDLPRGVLSEDGIYNVLELFSERKEN